jgi:hypothetical protein
MFFLFDVYRRFCIGSLENFLFYFSLVPDGGRLAPMLLTFFIYVYRRCCIENLENCLFYFPSRRTKREAGEADRTGERKADRFWGLKLGRWIFLLPVLLSWVGLVLLRWACIVHGLGLPAGSDLRNRPSCKGGRGTTCFTHSNSQIVRTARVDTCITI